MSADVALQYATRGLVILGPDELGVPHEVHEQLSERQRELMADGQRATPANVPEMIDVLASPGLVAAFDQILGENWAIVPFASGGGANAGGHDQHWHKDDNAHGDGRKQRHHQAVQAEILYFPRGAKEDMGPTGTIPYSQYWTTNHEENQDNFAGPDHMDFAYMIGGTWHTAGPGESTPVSGEDSEYAIDDIVNRRTAHDQRLRDAVSNTGWPLVRPYEAAPLAPGSVLIISHNLYHRGNHRRDDWRTWEDNPRYMWRFWLYRTTDPAPESSAPEVDWNALGVDPLTGVDLSTADEDITEVWRYIHHWMHTGAKPAPAAATTALSAEELAAEAERLSAQLYTKYDQGEALRIGAAYRLASLGDEELALEFLGRALRTERENVRRAATYGLIALGPASAETFVEATRSPVKWLRKAGAYGLGDAAQLNRRVLDALVERLQYDPSVYVRAVAAGSLGCLGRRAVATGVGVELVPECALALAASLGREENRPCQPTAQGRSTKFLRPTDDSDVCEGYGMDVGHERFEKVRSAVRENALWALVILCSHGADVLGEAFDPTVAALGEVTRTDNNVACVGYALDAINRLANLHPRSDAPSAEAAELRGNLFALLEESPVQSPDSLLRGGLDRDALALLTSAVRA